MSSFSFREYIPGGSAPTQGSPEAGRRGGQDFTFNNYQTGANPRSTENSWNNEFMRGFITNYQRAMDEGKAHNYFLNRRDGIAMVDQRGKDDQGVDQVVRAGDVFSNGAKVGNLYDRYGSERADQILTPLMVSAQEQRHGVTVAQKREQVQRDMAAFQTRSEFDSRVQDTKDEWGETYDAGIAGAGAVGGAAIGASAGGAIGALFGGIGAVPGAIVGGIVGGVAGGIGSWWNRDEIEDMAARGKVQAEMLDRETWGAGHATRLQTYSQLAGEFTNPLKQVVHGAAENTWGVQGDDKSAFYATDENGDLVRSPIWTGVDVAAGLGGAALQFASPVGRIAFQGTMGGTIAGKTGTLALSGGQSFDERTGAFDNVFLDEDGQFNVVSSLAGIGEIGIDVLQLGMGRGLSGYARSTLGKQAVKDRTVETLAGFKFTTNAAGTMTHRLSVQAFAPSELVQAMAARSAAQLRTGSGAFSTDDLYKAAQAIANGSNFRKAVLLNTFGEATEEGLQVALEAMSHQQAFTLEEVAEAAVMGGAMGAGMTIGSRVGAVGADGRRRNQANQLLQLQALPEISEADWKKMGRAEQDAVLAQSPEATYVLKEAAKAVAERAKTDVVATRVDVQRVVDAQHAQVARERNSANVMLDGTYVISKASYDIDDHMVQASINTVADLFERNLGGLREQSRLLEGDALAAHETTIQVAEEILRRVRRDQAEFYAEGTSPARQVEIAKDLNQALQALYTYRAGDPLSMAKAKASTLTFLRNPADNPGSFQGLLPQVSVPSSREMADGFLQVTLGPTQAMGGDFDGDKITLSTRVHMDDDVFRTLRTGQNLLGALSDPVNVMQRVFEDQQIPLLKAARNSSVKSDIGNSARVFEQLRLFLDAELVAEGVPFAQEVQAEFLRKLSQGEPGAKTWLMSTLATQYPAEMAKLANENLSNPWFRINSFFHRQLQTFQFAQAAALKPEAVGQIVRPIAADSEVGRVRARSAASVAQTISFEVLGSDLFRKWQALHYAKINSPQLTTEQVLSVQQEMSQFYEALNAGKSRSDLEALLAKDMLLETVSTQLMTLAASQSSDFNGRRATLPLLANLMVPEIQGEKYRGNVTLARWLLLQAVDAEEARLKNMGTYDADTDAQAQFSKYRQMNDGEVFAEVFGGWSFYELLGVDAAVYGENLTVSQWLGAYVNQSDHNKKETGRLLRLHASYKKLNREQGRHNLPYYVEDMEGDTAISPYQAMTDALLQAGNAKISWNDGKVGGRIGDSANQTSESLRQGVTKLHEAARLRKVNTKSAAAWQQMLNQNPDMARAFLAMIPDSAVDSVYHITADGEVHIARWVYEMLTMKPAEAEMELFRQTLIASWRSGVSTDDSDAGENLNREYHRLTDRMHQLMYRLAKDTRTNNHQRFMQQLFTAKDVDTFIRFVNDQLRANEAPYTAWSRDVAEVDPSVTKGGWQQLLPSSQQRTAITEFSAKAGQFLGETNAEIQREAADNLVWSQLRDAVSNQNSSSRHLLKNLQSAIDFSRDFRAALGPAAMQRSNLAGLLGAMANMTDKGKAASLIAVNGAYDARGMSLKFGTGEEIAWSSLTANSVEEAAGDPSLLAMDDFTLVDSDGNQVNWERLTAEQFVEAWAQPENRNLLRAIVFPSVFEHTVDDKVGQVSIIDMSLSALVSGHDIHDAIYGNSKQSKHLYAAMIEGTAGQQALQRYANKLNISQLTSRAWTLQNPDEAGRIVADNYAELTDILRVIGELAQVDTAIKVGETTSTVNALAVVREEVRQGLVQRFAQAQTKLWASPEELESMLQAAVLTRNYDAANIDPNDEAAVADLEARVAADETSYAKLTEQVERMKVVVEGVSGARMKSAWGLPAKAKKESDEAWLERTGAKRLQLFGYARGDSGIQTLARWASGIEKSRAAKGEPDAAVDMLPELTVKEWQEMSLAVIANEVQLHASTTVPGLENVRVPMKGGEAWVELHDPTYQYLVDELLDPSSAIVQAAVRLHKTFHRPETGSMLATDLAKKLLNGLFSADNLGPWDDRIADQILQANSRIDSSGAPYGIAQGGMGPRNVTTEGEATRRTYEQPTQAMRSTIVLKPLQLASAKDLMLPITRANGNTGLMQLSELDGRFVDEITVTLADGSTVDLLRRRPEPGLVFDRGPDTTWESITLDRLRNSLSRLDDVASVEVKFLHPADQPAGAAWANNVYFEGTILEVAGDNYESLIAGWWFAPGGIDPESSAQSLGASKKQQKALKEVKRVTSRQKKALEAGWESDFYQMLVNKTNHLMQLDLGDGRRINRGFRNAAFKTMKMRHLVRGFQPGTDTPMVLTAEQVIAHQQAGTPLDSIIDLPSPYVLSDQALRTMLGEQGDRGELRVATKAPDMNLANLQRWTGEITANNRANLPGLFDLKPRSLFSTHAANRRTMRKLGAVTAVSQEERQAYLRRMEVQQQLASEIGEARFQSNDPSMYARAGQAALDHARNGGMVNLDAARVRAGLPSTPADSAFTKGLDDLLLSHVESRMSKQQGMTGFIFRFTLPRDTRPAFGEMYGLESLKQRSAKSSHVAAGDFVSIDLDTAGQATEAEIDRVLAWFANTGATISLTSTTNSFQKVKASEQMRELGYRRVEGSDSLWEPMPRSEVSATIQSRYDRLMETEGVETANLIVFAQTDHWGFAENAAGLTGKGQTFRTALTVDLMPTQAWANFGLPLAEDMPIIRQRLDESVLPALIKQSELMNKGKPLSKAQVDQLREALDRARSSLNDQGLYNPGHNLQIGDLIPLYNRKTRQLILYRHGHKPPAHMGELNAQFRNPELTDEQGYGPNTAIYGADPLPVATTHSGEVIQFQKSSRYGLRAQIKVPLSQLADKTVIEGAGHKLLAVSLMDTLAGEAVDISTGISGWDVSYVIGRDDALKKEAFDGLVDNFRDAFTYLGFDFRPVLAEALYGATPTESQISSVAQMLGTFQRNAPKLTVREVDELIKGSSLRSTFSSIIAEAMPAEGLQSDWIDRVSSPQAPADRVLNAALLYLMTDGARVEHILSSSGVNHVNAHQSGLYVRKMPRLFTQVFDMTSTDDELRKFMVKELNKRFDNPGAPYGWTMDNNFLVTFHNPNPKHTFTGYLQFAQGYTSGDNPVLNLMSQERQSKQSASAQQQSMAAMSIGAQTSTTGDLARTASRLAAQGRPVLGDGMDLIADLRNIPEETNLDLPTQLTMAEIEYERHGWIVLDSLRQELETGRWSAEDKSQYLTQRSVVASAFGLSDREAVIDYWIRYQLYRRKDAESPEEGGNPGYVNAAAAMETLDHFLALHAEGVLPLADGLVDMMHPVDLYAMHQSSMAGNGSFELKDDGQVVTEWEDWVSVALALGDKNNKYFEPATLTANDANFRLYSQLGLGLKGLPSSLYRERADLLMDPETQELMMSLSPDRAAAMSSAEISAVQSSLEGIFGGRREGMSWFGMEPSSTALGQQQRHLRRTAREYGAQPMAHTRDSLVRHGERLQSEGTVQNGILRAMVNLRVAMATINPMLTIGAPVEQFLQTSLDDAKNLLLGQSSTSRMSVARSISAEEAAYNRKQIDALAHQQEMKSMLFGEFSQDTSLYNASRFEKITAEMAKFGGRIQDPYYKMRANGMVRRYVEAAVIAFGSLGTTTNMTSRQLLNNLATNPTWLRDTNPWAHRMAMNTVKEMKNMKDNTFSVAWKGLVEPLSTSSRLGVSLGSTLTLKLPYMFASYTSSKAIQILGLQGLDATLALLLHGRKKGLLGRLQSAVAGRPYAGDDDVIDMGSVIESVDLANAFIKSGITHSGLMAAGLMLGNLGLSGEDEEDRRRRKAAKARGYAYLYDPRDVVNDFRNADAVYLDWLPFGLDELFRVPGEDGGPGRSMAEMNWLMRQVFSPMIGMERFFNTGNPWEIWWGFEDAFYSFPLVNTTLVNDARSIFSELADSALGEEAIASPESAPRAFNFWVKAVMNLERMLLESSFINMLYVASDKYDRDAWAKPLRGEDGDVVRNKLGLPERTTALRDYIDPATGEVAQGYVGRDWTDATVRGYAENRATLALLGSLYAGITGRDGYMRGDMVVKTRTLQKDEVTPEIATAHVLGLWKGTIDFNSPNIENLYIPHPMRKQLEAELKQALVEEGMVIFGGDERKATSRMWDLWKGDPANPMAPGLGATLYSDKISYSPTTKYYQLNTTYVIGPDGRPWATGIDRHNFTNLAGMAPLQRFIGTIDNAQGVDSRLNYTDKVRDINTGLRGLERVDESFTIKGQEDAAAGKAAMQQSFNNGGSGWVDYGRRGGSGWRNFGRRSGWRNFGRRSGGGGGGSSIRINTPERQQVPYANDIDNINMTNPILRRASIRRERIDSQKGRLKPWQ